MRCGGKLQGVRGEVGDMFLQTSETLRSTGVMQACFVYGNDLRRHDLHPSSTLVDQQPVLQSSTRLWAAHILQRAITSGTILRQQSPPKPI